MCQALELEAVHKTKLLVEIRRGKTDHKPNGNRYHNERETLLYLK